MGQACPCNWHPWTESCQLLASVLPRFSAPQAKVEGVVWSFPLGDKGVLGKSYLGWRVGCLFAPAHPLPPVWVGLDEPAFQGQSSRKGGGESAC